jgi:hypothetical protein
VEAVSAEEYTLKVATAPESSLVIVEAVPQCSGFPSAWDALGEDGRRYYIRYRHCGIEVSLFGADGLLEDMPVIDADFDPWPGPGGGGVMSYEELRRYTVGLLVLPEREAADLDTRR